MSFCRIKFNLIFIVYVIFYLLLNLMMSISEPADMTVFFQNVTLFIAEHDIFQDVYIVVCTCDVWSCGRHCLPK